MVVPGRMVNRWMTSRNSGYLAEPSWLMVADDFHQAFPFLSTALTGESGQVNTPRTHGLPLVSILAISC
eukprot:Skav225381  [mRNA]  locus=scaffold3431:89427:89633:- [translate_table: standard]